MESCCFLKGKKYFYSPKTNTIVNTGIEELYSKHEEKRAVKIEDVLIDKESIQSSVKTLKQLIFETTQACNLECRYCTYNSGRYLYNRPTSSGLLNIETAQTAIRYIFGLIKDRTKKEFTISFYGGEPLLNFEVIRRIVDYSNIVFNGWNLQFIITTNGTLLNEENIKFFLAHSFLIFFSIDGHKENHDAKRIHPNGEGSHGILMKNLELIKSIDEKYYFNNIFLSAVYSKDLPFDKLFYFFRDNELLNRLPIKLGFVNEYDTDYYEYYPYSIENYKESRNIIFDAVLLKKKNKVDLLPIEDNFLVSHKSLNQSLKTRYFTSLMGACFYNSRLFVDANGHFHICEKMNDKFSIGNVADGYHFSFMESLLHDYVELIKKNCMDCDFNFLCQRCFVHFAKDGKFEFDPSFCANSRKAFTNLLEEHIRLNEEDLLR